MILKKQMMSLVQDFDRKPNEKCEHAEDCRKAQQMTSPYVAKVNKIKQALAEG